MTVPIVRFAVRGRQESATSQNRTYTVVYDGDCSVCTKLANQLDKWDRRDDLEIISSQTPGVSARFPWIPARAYVEALQIVAADGTTWQGAEAIEKLLDVLPKGRLVSWIFKIPFVRPLADRFYRWFARNRYRLGCGEHCQSRPLDVIWSEAENAEKTVSW